MRHRVEDLLLPAGIRPPLIATFHSACVRILRERAVHAGLPPSFVIYDEDDRQALVKEALRELDFDERTLTPSTVVHRISHCKNQMLTPADVEQLARTPREERIASLYRLYEQKLQARRRARLRRPAAAGGAAARDGAGGAPLVPHAVDATCWWTSTRTPTARSTASSQLLTEEHRNLCVVGDPDQSVYRWRGRRPPQHPRLREGLSRLPGGGARAELPLDQAHPRHRLRGHRATTPRAGTSGCGPRTTRASVPRSTARGTRTRSRPSSPRRCARLRGEGRDYRDMAVFYRTNAQSRVLEDALRRAGVPYLIVGGVRFYERREIRDVVAYLRLIVEPARRRRVPARGGRARARDRQGHPRPPGRRRARGGRAAARALRRDSRRHHRQAAPGAGGVRAADRAPGRAPARPDRARPHRRGVRGLRLSRGAQGGAHRRGPGPAREPGGAGGRVRGVHRHPAGGRARDGDPRGLPRLDRAGGRHRRDRSGGGRGDAHDAPLGQGARVPGGLPHRARGGRLPPLALHAGAGGAGGGAAPLLRRHHPGPRAAAALLRAPPPHPGLRGRRALALPPRDPGGAAPPDQRAPAGSGRARGVRGGRVRSRRRLPVPPGRQAPPRALGRGPAGGHGARGRRRDRHRPLRQRRPQAPLAAIRPPRGAILPDLASQRVAATISPRSTWLSHVEAEETGGHEIPSRSRPRGPARAPRPVRRRQGADAERAGRDPRLHRQAARARHPRRPSRRPTRSRSPT